MHKTVKWAVKLTKFTLLLLYLRFLVSIFLLNFMIKLFCYFTYSWAVLRFSKHINSLQSSSLVSLAGSFSFMQKSLHSSCGPMNRMWGQRDSQDAQSRLLHALHFFPSGRSGSSVSKHNKHHPPLLLQMLLFSPFFCL